MPEGVTLPVQMAGKAGLTAGLLNVNAKCSPPPPRVVKVFLSRGRGGVREAGGGGREGERGGREGTGQGRKARKDRQECRQAG